MSSSKPSCAHAGIEPGQRSVLFRGKQYTLNFLKTSQCDFLMQSTNATKALINTYETGVASGHFFTVSKRCPMLQHGDKNLEDHIMDLNGCTYLYNKVIFLKHEAVIELAQKSNHPEAKKNREEFIQLIDTTFADIIADDDESKPYDGKKKARTDDDGASASNIAEVPTCVADVDDMQMDDGNEMYSDLHLVVPLLHERNEAEQRLIQIFKSKKEIEINHIHMVDAQALAHEDAMQERLIAKNERQLIFDRQRIQLEHERRMIADDEYRRMNVQEAEAAATNAKEEKEAEELKSALRTESADKKAKAEKEEAELKTKVADRARKAAETRRKRAAAKDLKDKLEEYGAATKGRARLVLLPALNEALKETMPDDKDRADYMKSLDADESVASNGKGGVYVLGYDGLPHSRYVGYSKNIDKRISQHRSGEGAKCLKGATNIKKINTITVGSMDNLDAWERVETIAQMLKLGINNVRGWHYVSPYQHSISDRAAAIKNICSDKNLCVRCGFANHYVAECTSNGVADWMI